MRHNPQTTEMQKQDFKQWLERKDIGVMETITQMLLTLYQKDPSEGEGRSGIGAIQYPTIN